MRFCVKLTLITVLLHALQPFRTLDAVTFDNGSDDVDSHSHKHRKRASASDSVELIDASDEKDSGFFSGMMSKLLPVGGGALLGAAAMKLFQKFKGSGDGGASGNGNGGNILSNLFAQRSAGGSSPGFGGAGLGGASPPGGGEGAGGFLKSMFSKFMGR